MEDRWEADSGFSSAVSSPAHDSNSSCPPASPYKVVALDCEMVGTGVNGHTSELARCSIVNYYGDVLYDAYVKPREQVSDYRTRWSGICKHHLVNAIPFKKARREILAILKGKIVVGHALHNDFRALSFVPPNHLIRDTGKSPLLRHLSDFPVKGGVSLKNLTKKLLKRNIQYGRSGHSSVEDAVAAMDLYKLVECQWECAILSEGQNSCTHSPDLVFSPSHFMQDEYWPEDASCVD